VGSGRGAAWLARLLGVQEVRGSNPRGPTKRFQSMPTVYIAGAGCSHGMFDGHPCCPPIAKDFITHLKEPVPGWASNYPEIKKVIDHLEKTSGHIGLEEVWTCVDLHAKFPEAVPISWEPRRQVVQELKSVLVWMYGRSCDELAEKILPSHECPVAMLTKEMPAGDTLISFNYDTVVERVVKKISGKTLRHGKDLRPGTIRFAKPHGSASWAIASLDSRDRRGADTGLTGSR
jgi:hypothetical protein